MSDFDKCDYKSGSLPSCAPLAAAYVPFQSENSPKYNSREALSKGTLFPGLDLPWKNMTGSCEIINTPLSELQALDFAITELGLYLDTHHNDADALDLYKSYVNLYNSGKEKYVKLYGPIVQTDVSGKYSWVNSPWPWQLKEER